MAQQAMTVGKINLRDLEVQELRDMLIEKEVDFSAQAKQAGLMKIIMTCGKFDVPRRDGAKRNEAGNLVHPIHGEYINCIVHPQSKYNQNGAIYVGINKYSVMVNPRVPVKLPKGVIKFLKQSTEAHHVFDKMAVSENGNIGAHLTVQKPKYVVEILLEDDDEDEL